MAIAISCGDPPDGNIGVPYTHTFPVTGAPEGEPLEFAIVGGMLPPGLTLNSSTGTVSGTPTAGGTYYFVIRVTVVRDPIVSATLHVTTSLTGSCLYPAYEAPLVGANGIATVFRCLVNLDHENAPAYEDYTWPQTTNSVDVIGGDEVTAHPELAFDPSNLIYPVDFRNSLGATFSPGGILDLLVYGASMDVVRSDSATGTLYPRGYSVVGTPTTNSYVLNPELAVDDDDDTYATIHHDASHLPTLSQYSNVMLEIGTEGWVALGDDDTASCSIRIIGPANWLEIWVWRQLFAVSSVEDDLRFPSGYERALMLQLAADFGRQYPGHDLSKIKKKLAAAVAHIDAENVSNSQAVEELPPPAEEQS